MITFPATPVPAGDLDRGGFTPSGVRVHIEGCGLPMPACRCGRARRVWTTPPAWFRIVPGTDPASRAANLSNWQGVLMIIVVMPVVLATIALAHLLSGGPVSSTAPTGSPLPLAVCTTDEDCARHDAWVAQDVYGVAVWANTPHVTPVVTEARHGQYVTLSCDDPARRMVDTSDGVACR